MLVYAVVGGTLLAYIALSLPPVQRWLGRVASAVLSEELGSSVHIASIDATAFGRAVLNSVDVLDEHGDSLLYAQRMSARIDLKQLFAGHIKVGHVQVFSADVQIRRDSSGTLNCQYLIDKFTSDKTSDKSTDWKISNIVMRRSRMCYKSNSNKLTLNNMSVTAFNIGVENSDFSCILRDMRFDSDLLNVSNVHAIVEKVGANGGLIRNAHVSTANSMLGIDSLTWKGSFEQWSMRTLSNSHISMLDIPRKLYESNELLASVLAVVPPLNVDIRMYGDARTAHVDRLQLGDDSGLLSLHTTGSIGLDTLRATMSDIRLNVDKRIVSRLMKNETEGMPLTLTADFEHSEQGTSAKGNLGTTGADVQFEGSLDKNREWRAKLSAKSLAFVGIMRQFAPTQAIANSINDNDGRVDCDINARGSLKSAYCNISAALACNCTALSCNGTAEFEQGGIGGTHIATTIDIAHVQPSLLGASGRLAEHIYASQANVDLRWGARQTIEDVVGRIQIGNTRIINSTQHSKPLIGKLFFDIHEVGDGIRQVDLTSNFMMMKADISGRLSNIVSNCQSRLAQIIPSVMKVPEPKQGSTDNWVKMTMLVYEPSLLSHLTDTEIGIADTLMLTVAADSTASLAGSCHNMTIGDEQLSDLKLKGTIGDEGARLSLDINRKMKGGTAHLSAQANAEADSLNAVLKWVFDSEQPEEGKVNNGLLQASAYPGDTTIIKILPSKVNLNGEEWTVKRSNIDLLPKGAMRINRFAAENGQRHLRLNGQLSANANDTVLADLNKVNLGYVFDLVNFDDIELDGDATGRVYVTGAMSKPVASGRLSVDAFSFNKAPLGQLILDAAWNTANSELTLDGHISGMGVEPQSSMAQRVPADTHISGYVRPGNSNPNNGLDLRVDANGFNLGFLNEYTEGIADNVVGAVSGKVRIFGPLKKIDLEGRIKIDHLAAHVPSLNVGYRAMGDSAIIVPGEIQFKDMRLFDPFGTLGPRDHQATLSGSLMHKNLKRWAYSFTANATNFLGYDVREFGNESFHATAFLSGRVNMSGEPGQMTVNVNGTTMPNSELVYNSEAPGGLASSDFITYVSSKDYTAVNGTSDAKSSFFDPGTDLRLNFDLNVTPDAQLRVLMDNRNGDMIELYGSGNIKVNYYNKGSFTMRGLYTIDHGRYNMTINGPIRRDFKFEDGNINFTGNPMQSTLNMKAAYVVSGARLNDLATGSPFSSSTVRVNCLLNLTGTVSAPQVSFDFDLINASQDEKAMVKSLVSTEEERNLQAIYLLSLNTFYSQDESDDQSRSTGMINSLISSTLSNQLNSVLSNAVGSNNWNVGTNISTSQAGWKEMQAEGSITGRLFNNRLLVNGTFGYREGGTTTTTGFVGDFDMLWRLTQNGTINLKAYSQTTDRYFTKSALTTQGLGLLLQKDFNKIRELFNIKKKK